MAKKTTFTLAANIAGNANAGILVGDFNNWDESNGVQLKKEKDGALTAEVALEPGTYHYRYFLEDGRWENDSNAEHYSHVPGLHVDNCVITVKEEKAAPKTAAKAKAPVEESPKAEAPKKPAAPKKAAAPKKEEAPKAEPKPKAAPAPKAKAEAKPKAEPKAPAKPAATKNKK